MLAIFDVPESVIELHKKGKQISQDIFSDCLTDIPVQNVPHETNVYETYPESIIAVKKGIYKEYYNDRLIRFYTSDDIIYTSNYAPTCNFIVSEMASQIRVIPAGQFLDYIKSRCDLMQKWSSYLHIQSRITAGMVSAFINDECRSKINIKTFAPGETIIAEGDTPDCLYEMIEGHAAVTIKGTEVGKVHPAEVFGEVSFLTGSFRTASVVAISQCLVQCMNGHDFNTIIKLRPALVFNISKTIAKRLSEVNERLVRITSLT